MAQANDVGGGGANRAARQPLVRNADAAVQPPAVVLAAAPVVGPGHARFDIEAVLLGPVPTKGNICCKIHPRIDETWP